MSSLRDLSVKTKLSVGFGLSFMLMLVVGVISVGLLRGVNDLAVEATEHWLPEMETLAAADRALQQHWLLAQRRTNTRNFRQIAEDTENMLAAEAVVDDMILRISVFVEENHGRHAGADLVDRWSSYRASLVRVFHELDSGNPIVAQQELEETATPALAEMTQIVKGLIETSKAEGLSATGAIQQVYNWSLAILAAVLLIAVACTGLAIRWISRSVTTPILAVSCAMRQLTSGEQCASINDGIDRRDEIGTLVRAASGYRDSIQRVHQLAREADLERERLDAALNNMAHGLCMFDADKRLVTFNKPFAEIFGFQPEQIVPGTSIDDVMELIRSVDNSPAEARAVHRKIVCSPEGGTAIATLTDERIIALSHRPIADGGVIVTCEDVTEKRKAEDKIRRLAHYDVLTDLPNRAFYRERMGAILEDLGDSETMVLMSVDLDRFKSVNDLLGHPIGDLLLQCVTARMRDCLRDSDIVARLGGDEFSIILYPVDLSTMDIADVARRLIASVSAPYELEGHQAIIGASVGIAVAPFDGTTPEILTKNADLALYRAKEDGGCAFRFFEADMDSRMRARQTLEYDLRNAVAGEAFELHYQPIVSTTGSRIETCEALVRWQHPERGLVPPNEFIPVAEETGLLVPIGKWVLRHACAEAMTWPDHVRVAVNLSPAQFMQPGIYETVIEALDETGLPAHRLELEITEMVLLEGHRGAFEPLHKLRELGIRIAMDDFGTGYSSLSYLRSFPFDKIKVDQSFVRDLGHRDDAISIIRAVIGLSRSLGISVVAEGVETEEQLMRLQAEGCNAVQGYLFGRPARAELITPHFANSGLHQWSQKQRLAG